MFGKRGKPRGQQVPDDPRNLFGPAQLPRPSGPPASSTPLADYLAQARPGVDHAYVVLPRSLAEAMSLPWQQQLVNLLAQFHEVHGGLTWPVYRVVPSRYERLADLDEEQLAEAGFLVEIDADGEMVYRERNGRRVEDPAGTAVLVSCLDPIVPRAVPPPASDATEPSSSSTAPMNIGPQPTWPAAGASAPPQARPTDVAPKPAEPAGSPADSVTPPRGTALPSATSAQERGWFDDMAEPDQAAPTVEQPQPGSEQAAQGGEFGPTGEPTEIPYRYRR